MNWVKSRKLKVLEDLKAGKETTQSLWEKYELSPEEIEEWQNNLERFGELSLRITYANRYRRRK